MPASIPDGARLWLVRHGETEWSRDGRHTGRTDIGLTDVGRRQAQALAASLGRELAEARRVVVYCSPRARARDTAQLAGLAVDAIDDDLAEWDYGDYEGRTTAEIRSERPGWSVWADGVPNGEAIEQVAERADRVLSRAATELSDEGTAVVLVAHGHISRVLAARWIGADPTFGMHLLLNTAAPSLLSAQYGEPAIDRWNLPPA